jgi:hypothetical protein
MGNMTLAVPEDLKREMERFPVINWSEVARQAFLQRIQELKILESITKDSKLTEKDVEELSKKIKTEIRKKHEKGS